MKNILSVECCSLFLSGYFFSEIQGVIVGRLLARQGSSNYMDSCEKEKEEGEVDKRGNSSHTTSRYPCLGVDPNPQPEKENRQLTPIGLHLVLRLLRVSLDGSSHISTFRF